MDDKKEVIQFRNLLSKGILDKEIFAFLGKSDPPTEVVMQLVKDMFEQGNRTYNMSDGTKMLLLMRMIVGLQTTSNITNMKDLLPVSLLQDTLQDRMSMIEKVEKDEEKDLVRKLEAAYISKELADAREIARENARLKSELEETKKKLEKLDEDVILKTRDTIARIFSSTSSSIQAVAKKEAADIK